MIEKMTVEVVYHGLLLTVEGEYYPRQREVLYFRDGSGQPAEPADFDIHSIKCDGIDMTEFFDDTIYEEIVTMNGTHYEMAWEQIRDLAIIEAEKDIADKYHEEG